MNGDDTEITRAECALRCGVISDRLTDIEKDLAKLDRDCVEVKRWQAEHDGRINAYWSQQFKVNSTNDDKFNGLFKRVIVVENRAMWAAGFAACGGAIVGVALSVFASKIIGG
jgi:hypothetical protein